MSNYDNYARGHILEGQFKPEEHTGPLGTYISAVKYVQMPHSRDWYGQVSDGKKIVWEGFTFSCPQAAKLAKHAAKQLAGIIDND